MNRNRQEKGITLIALVITIIILLILAGITIISLRNNGLIDKTAMSKNEYKNAQIEEEQSLKNLENKIEEETSVKKEEGTKVEGVKIGENEYTFTCIDTNYQGYNLYLCDEVIPYSVCGPHNSPTYSNSALRTWLNDNAPEDAIEITLDDTGTKEKMFILSKEENEKYEEYTAIEWEGSHHAGNNCYWTRTYAGRNGWVYCREHTGEMTYLDVVWTAWNGCKPVYVSDK